MPFNPDKLKKLVSGGAASARTGGKGSVRRKHKAVRKNTAQDDKRLKSTLNKLNVRDIPAIEEVNLFKDDGNVIHFASPKGALFAPFVFGSDCTPCTLSASLHFGQHLRRQRHCGDQE
jgi:hypothetical protein